MKGHSMSIKLPDMQLVMLSAAAQRDDRCLIAPKNLKGGAAQKVAAKLIAAGLVKEIRAKAGAPVWRRDEQGQFYALRLTAAGAKAIAIDESPASHEADDGNERKQAAGAEARVAHAPPNIPPADAAPTLSAPRAGTKLAKVIGLLQRDSGATLDELVASTGWLPHTTRAALTGLRKRGFPVAIDRSDKQRGSTYRVRMDRANVSEIETTGEDPAQLDEPPAAKSEEAGRLGAVRAPRAA
jgi:hypothetical protein